MTALRRTMFLALSTTLLSLVLACIFFISSEGLASALDIQANGRLVQDGNGNLDPPNETATFFALQALELLRPGMSFPEYTELLGSTLGASFSIVYAKVDAPGNNGMICDAVILAFSNSIHVKLIGKPYPNEDPVSRNYEFLNGIYVLEFSRGMQKPEGTIEKAQILASVYSPEHQDDQVALGYRFLEFSGVTIDISENPYQGF